MDLCRSVAIDLPPPRHRFRFKFRFKMPYQVPRWFVVRVEWDTDGKKVKLPKVVRFMEDACVHMQEFVEDEEDFEYRVVKMLEETYDWLVADWEIVEKAPKKRTIKARVPKE